MTYSDQTNQPLQVPSSAGFHQDQILGGRYRVLSLLGQGGMGVVYKVEQIFLGKELALKTIVKSEQTDDLLLRRFETEARAVFSVNHPNIIAVHDFGLLDDQTPFMAMEFVDGKTLGQILKNRPLSVDETIPLFIQVCFGLAHAHENGIVHRDVKPNNIMVLNNSDWGTEGSVKILDFGIAKLAQHEGGEMQSLTRTGEIFGSPLYMSPEQCLGGKLDHRSDIYSLGCVLFEALTGTPPFVGENAMNTMMMHQRATIPTLKEASLGQEFPQLLEQIVHGMLAKNPDERYQNLGYTAHDLAGLKRGGVTVEKTPMVTVPRPVKPDITAPDMVKIQKSHFYTILISTAAVCAILTGAITQWLLPSKPVPVVQENTQQQAADPGIDTGLLHDYSAGIASDDSVEGLQKKISRQEGEFSATNFPTDKTLEAFKNYEHAQLIALTDCAVTDAGLSNLSKSKLLELDLGGDKNIRTVDEIAKQEYLQRVNLRNTSITDKALVKLAKLPMLDQLDITGCDNISQHGLMALTSSPSLVLVQLSGDKYSNDFIGQLQAKLPQCMFRPYFDKANLEQEASKTTEVNKFKQDEHLYNFVSKANPLSRLAARYSQGMANEDTATMQLRDEYAKRAQNISEQTKDWKELCGSTLNFQAQRARTQGRMKECIAIRERALNLDLDTTKHNDRQLLHRILGATNIFRSAGEYAKVIKYCELAEQYFKQYPQNENEDYLPRFDERIGWTYYQMKQAQKGAPYLSRSLNYWKKHQNDPIKPDPELPERIDNPKNLYARALIEMGHSESDQEKRKALYDEALQLLESLNIPEDIDLNEHYCDACNHMADIYAAESNSAESLKYLRRGLAAVKQMKHKDEHNRLKFFTDKIAGQEKSAK